VSTCTRFDRAASEFRCLLDTARWVPRLRSSRRGCEFCGDGEWCGVHDAADVDGDWKPLSSPMIPTANGSVGQESPATTDARRKPRSADVSKLWPNGNPFKRHTGRAPRQLPEGVPYVIPPRICRTDNREFVTGQVIGIGRCRVTVSWVGIMAGGARQPRVHGRCG
jgi:hypothetical protein